MNTKFLTAKDVASLFKVSKAFAYRLISQGVIPSVHIGKSVRVRSEDLEKYIQDNLSGQQLADPYFSNSTLDQPTIKK